MVAGSPAKFPGPSEVDMSGEGRVSKRLITDTRNNVLISSANAVLSNADLLTEILLLLPAISLFLYKSVSKQWLSVITCPTFTLRLSQKPNVDPPSGFFVWGPKRKSKRNMFEYNFISFDIRIPSKISTVFTFSSKAPAKVLHSCNGLLLCYITPDKFLVYNPCVNLFKMLPQPHMSNLELFSFTGGIRLVFDPTKSPHYKVVRAQLVTDDNDVSSYILIETYSSEIGNWSVCVDRKFSYQSFRSFENGIYWNGAIHWLGYVFGPSLHFKLDILLDHPVLTTIKLPVTVDGNLYCNRKLFESRGRLFLACMRYAYSRQLHILEMRNGYSEWSVKYLIDDLMLPSPSTWGIYSSVWCIVLGEREEDSFMVIESDGKVLQYKIVLNTVHTLFDFGSTPRESFPFIASFAAV
ncbi:retrovirus-related pol polyprotein from transposon TNT 1-94 [Tanacetum coccineum]